MTQNKDLKQYNKKQDDQFFFDHESTEDWHGVEREED